MMHFISAALAVSAMLSSIFSLGQEIKLVDAKDVLKKGRVLFDSARYEDAAKEFLIIHESDTAYTEMLSELVLTYNGAKDYKKTIQTAQLGLSRNSEYRAHFMRILAIAQDKDGDYAKSVATFMSALKEFPFDFSLLFSLAITHYNRKEYKIAEEYLIKTLSVNPFHSLAYLNLGRLYAFQGRKTQSMISLGMYLSITNTDNSTLIFLEKLCNNEIADEGSIPSESPNPFSRIDQIIRAKIAMEPGYKTKIPINASLVKQYQLLSEQLSTVTGDQDNFWVKNYVPIYLDLTAKEMWEPFIYHILSSTKIEQVPKWKGKNEKSLNAFFSLANTDLHKIRNRISVPSEFAVERSASAYYNSNNRIEAIGEKDSKGIRYGHWVYFANNGVIDAIGSFDSGGKKIGIWKYFFPNEYPKSVENEENGLIERYNSFGHMYQRYYLKDGKVEGKAEILFDCGNLKETLFYSGGKREGKANVFYIDGTTATSYNYKNDDLDGEAKTFYENGQLKTQYQYVAGKIEGDYLEFHENGKVKYKGKYLHGELVGPWLYYYYDGKLEKKGSYNNEGYAFGDWTFYDVNGNLSETRTLSQKGEIEGDDKIYHKGKLHTITTYNNSIPVLLIFYDRSGKEISRSGDKSGTFSIKGYFPTGELSYDGSYHNGKMEGFWKHYHRNGKTSSEYTYKDGQVHGTGTEYFFSGEKKVISHYVDGELDGFYQEFYRNGNTKEQGWFVEGKRQQVWLTYYVNGSAESEYFYLNDELTGSVKEFSEDSKIRSLEKYENGVIKERIIYNSGGQVVFIKQFNKQKDELAIDYKNGVHRLAYEVMCGEATTAVVRSLPDKRIVSIVPMKNGRRNGNFVKNFLTGLKEGEGNYVNGSEDGLWTWYNANGKKSSSGLYVHGKYDSTWTFWNESGSLSRISNYKLDVRDDLTQLFSIEGILIEERMYDDDEIVSFRTLQKDGTMSEWKVFKGNETITAYHPNGKVASESNSGISKSYYNTGQIFDSYTYKNGELEGEFITYHANGKIRNQGFYSNGNLDGVNAFFNANGTPDRIENYKLGSPNGKMTYFDNGIKIKEFTFWCGILEE